MASGTQYLLAMSDAGPYVTGGSTPLMTVGDGSTDCMNSSSPSAGGSSGQGTAASSSAAASASVSGKGGSSSGGSSGNTGDGESDNEGSSSGSKTNTGAIVGGVIGGVVALALLGALLWFCLRRRERKRRGSEEPIIKSYGMDRVTGADRRRSGQIDLLDGRPGQVSPGADDAQYQPSPFQYTSPTVNGSAPQLPPIATASDPHLPAPGSNAEKPFSPGYAAHNRDSMESSAFMSGHTHSDSYGGTSTGGNFNPARPSGTWSEGMNTVSSGAGATAGAGLQPRSSINKHGRGAPAPSSPATMTSGRHPADPLPELEPATRFVQHEDSGEVV